MSHSGISRRKPQWLRNKLPSTDEYSFMKAHLTNAGLHTICESGKCPNLAECWKNKTATFMILGNTCTRSCRFCNVATGKPLPPDENEALLLAQTIASLKLSHCVITSVTRDDLPDQGSIFWQKTILMIKDLNPGITIEALIPDFSNEKELINNVIAAKPNIISHNLETVKRLTPNIRTKATYENSLSVVKHIADSGIKSKSGFMLGLGETMEEIIETLDDLIHHGCKVVTIGQYLQPGPTNSPVEKYYSPEEFDAIRLMAESKNYLHVECGPLVRSSYHAEKHI